MKQKLKNVSASDEKGYAKNSPFSNEARNAYVTEHLTEALLTLLREKPIGDISISELCDEAVVGRASFYRNYESKEDILRAYIGKLFHEWTDKYNEEGDGNRPISELILALFVHFEAYQDFYSLLNARGLVYLLKDIIMGLCGAKPEHSKLEAYSSAFAAYTLYGWIEVWFQRGMQESAEEMSKMFQSQGL